MSLLRLPGLRVGPWRRAHPNDSRPVMLFFRAFKERPGLTVMSGGDRKVWDYFQHVESSPYYRPMLRTRTRTLAPDNPWSRYPDRVVGRFRRLAPNAYFVAGMNWSHLARKPIRLDRPIINLVQHVRHAHDDDPRHSFLHLPAVRICVGPEVEDAVRATGLVRGPVITIPNGIDLPVNQEATALSARDIDIAVVGNKNPNFTKKVAARLERPGRRLEMVARFIERDKFLSILGRSRLVILIPRRQEGFYLPALEAMALRTPVVCPDCVGNRSFCVDGRTCWRPSYDLDAIVAAAEAAWTAEPVVVEQIREQAAQEAARHDLDNERRAFLEILGRLPDLWAQATAPPTP